MSTGYGGNLTYPSLKQFTNTNLNAEGKTAYTGFSDKRYTTGDVYTRFISEQIGMGSIPFIAGKSSWKIIWGQPSVAKTTEIHLNDEMTCTPCPYDFGFSVKTIAKKPGVLNSLFYGKVRPYYSSTKYVTDDGTGHIAADDHIKQTQEILDLILADTGLGNYDDEHKGAVVDAIMDVSLNEATAADKLTISIPSAGVSGIVDIVAGLTAITLNAAIESANPELLKYVHAVDAVGNSDGTVLPLELVSYYPGEFAVDNTGGPTTTLAIPAGFTVKEVRDGTITAPTNVILGTKNYINLMTKSKFQDEYTHQVQDASTGSTFTEAEGNFATMTSDDVFRQFAHRRNDRGFANMWRQEKPTDFPTSGPVQGTAPVPPADPAADYAPITTGWYKLILTTDMGTAAIHGASHGDSYRQQMELYLPEMFQKTAATSTAYSYLFELAKWWAMTPPAAPSSGIKDILAPVW
jgi:hypothetical protein